MSKPSMVQLPVGTFEHALARLQIRRCDTYVTVSVEQPTGEVLDYFFNPDGTLDGTGTDFTGTDA